MKIRHRQAPRKQTEGQRDGERERERERARENEGERERETDSFDICVLTLVLVFFLTEHPNSHHDEDGTRGLYLRISARIFAISTGNGGNVQISPKAFSRYQ